MEKDDSTQSKDTWTTVGKKPVVKKEKSAENLSGGFFGQTKASVSKAAAAAAVPPAVKKPEAIRIREEQLNRLKKKTAPLPEAIMKRSDSDSDSGDRNREGSSQPERLKTNQNEQSKKSPGKPGVNLQAALKSIDYKVLSAEVQKARTASPTGDASWKLLATLLNDKLKEVPSEAAFYAEDGFVWRYPLNVAPKNLTNLFDTAFSSAPKDLLEGYLDWLITDFCRNYLSKHKPIYGSQLIIQHLLAKNPDLISEKNLTDRVTDLKSYASRRDETIRDETLAILWAYGQIGVSSFGRGFDVWYKLMFPLFNDRRYTGFIVAYLVKLLENHKKHDFGKMNKAEVFLNIFDQFLGRNTIHFHKSTKAKISSAYFQLRDLLFKEKLKENASTYFAQFLMRLGQTQQPEPYLQAAAENLVTCLKADEKCLDVWRNKHQSSLIESQALLQHILANDTADNRAVRGTKKFTRFLDGVVDFEPNGKKEVPESFAEDNALAVETAKKLKKRIKTDCRLGGLKKFFLLVFLIAAAIGGEIMYNTPKGSYSVRYYNIAKPIAVEYWTVAKPAVIHTWDEYVKPLSYWVAVESVRLAKFSFAAAQNLWASMKTNLPQVYSVLLTAQNFAEKGAAQFGSVCITGLRKFDRFLLDMPPLSHYAEKALPLLDYTREQVAAGLVYVGHVVEHYISGNASTGASSSKTK